MQENRRPEHKRIWDSYGRATPDPKELNKGGKQLNQSKMNHMAI